MNQGIFRLVFSKVLNMYVPASEAVKTQTCKSSGRRARGTTKKIVALILVLTAPLSWAGSPAGIVPQNPSQWVGAYIKGTTENTFVVQQTANKAIQDFLKFNLDKGQLYQQLMGSSDSALLRIHDINPSLINGNIQAQGNLYLINQNGIIFGGNSQINVGTLYASSLDISDTLFNSGLLSNTNSPVFTGDSGFVAVEQGAQIFAATGGRVLLLAPSVTNNGLISTPDGQTILAAGNKVYLKALTVADDKIGFVGEDKAHLLVEVASGGTATNLGKIIADRGNVTLVGLAVNQQGTISASTSVRANGSIKLLARDRDDSGALRSGTVTLGKDSLTEVRVETEDTETITKGQADKTQLNLVTGQSDPRSKVIISGSNVDVEGKIIAKGGDVKFSNQFASFTGGGNLSPINRIYLGGESLIDVSGIDAFAPMERNQLAIQLYSNELNDVPLLRGTDLYKQIVYIDARKVTANGNVGTDIVNPTNMTAYLNNKERTIAELMTAGGHVDMAANEVIQRSGAVVDVSGGSTTYLPGSIKETTFIVNGKVIPISEVDANTTVPTLADAFTVKDSKWGVTRYWNLNGAGTIGWGSTYSSNNLPKISATNTLVASYKVGDDAGVISNQDSNSQATSAFTVQDGLIKAQTYVGQTQRAAQDLPLGGKIFLTGDFSATGDVLQDGFGLDTPLNQKGLRKLNVDFLNNGFNRVTLNGKVSTALNIKPKGEVVLNADINANVIAPSSNIVINAPASSASSNSPKVAIADGVTISSAGLFTNDTPGVIGEQVQPVAIDAGNITAGNNNDKLVLGKNVTFDASAGAWQQSKGEVKKGKAGDITLDLSDSGLAAGDQLRAYGFDKGGKLKITTPQNVNLAGQLNPSELNIAPDFIRQGGFSKFTFNAAGYAFGDGGVTDIYTNMQTWQLGSGFKGLASGSPMSLAASPWLAPEYLRQASSLELLSTDSLTLNENASIRTDVGGKVALEAKRIMAVLGDISTPTGEINLKVSGGIDINDGKNFLLYNPSNGLFIGEHANLNARGVYRTTPTNTGIVKAQEASLNGGAINISTSIGPIVLKEGSELDVSAASGVNDSRVSAGYQRETLYGDAGSISLTSRDGMLLDGDLKGNAAGTGRGGNLTLATKGAPAADAVIYPSVGTDFKVTQNKVLTAQGLNAGDALLPPTTSDQEILDLKGKAQISVAQISQGGFDNVSIRTNTFGKEIAFDAGAHLIVPNTLTLQSPQLSVIGNGTATIDASYVTLQQGDAAAAVKTDLAAGNNHLNINTNQLTVDGQVAVNQVNHTQINAKLDINGGLVTGATQGGLTAPGEIALTARTIYPITGSTFTIEATGADGKIIVNNSLAPVKPVISAQGTLNLVADNIEQNGTLKAPFGAINLQSVDAQGNIQKAKSITLGASSLTSVSGEGQLIPFSTTENSGLVLSDGAAKLADKAVSLKADNINQKAGSKIDLSGGGDMFAYEWIQGAGGSKDILAGENMFAILPSLGKDFAPVGTVYQANSAAVKPGDIVHLTGIEGLPTGSYTLLPARYALMPGAFLVKAGVKGNPQLPNTSTQQVNGYTLSSGYRETLNGKRDATWSTFEVVSGDILRPAAGTVSRSPSEYLITSASNYFAKQTLNDGKARLLPQDAGHLTLDATTSLAINGDIVANKAVGAHGASVDISSDNIRIVANTDAQAGALQLKATDLNKLNAESVLVGGTRNLDSNGTSNVSAGAKTVTIENNAANALLVPEFIATATDTLTVKSGAAINTGGALSKTGSLDLKSSKDGALLAVSAVNDITYSRAEASKTPTQGTLNVEAGANINSGKSLVLDATKSNLLKGTVKVATGGSATFGADRILLGNPALNVSGLNINSAVLADLGNLAKFTANSYKNIDVYGAVDFGNKDLDVTFNSAGIVGHMAAGENANIAANTLTIKNTSGATYESAAAAANSKLNINATNVVLEGNDAKDVTGVATDISKTTLGGFDAINVDANELRVSKMGATTFAAANTTLNTGRITAGNGRFSKDSAGKVILDTVANYKLASDANINTTQRAGAVSNIAQGIGGKLAVEANHLTVGSNIELASGNITLTSKTGDLNLTSGANVSAKSAEVTFYDKTVASSAGTVSLVSNNGNVNVNSGAVVDVSALGNANAGKLKVRASNAAGTGTANIKGELKGAEGVGGTGASLLVDADKLADLTPNSEADLTAVNKHATGFSESRQYRVRNQNVNVSGQGADAIKAKEVLVSADNGGITVTGDIDASAAKDGRIGLFAKNNVTLASTAKLLATSSNAGADGGTVDIDTTNGSLDLQTGASIDVHGGSGAEQTGKVNLRTPRVSIATTHLDAGIIGSKSTVLEAFRTFNATTLTTGAGNAATLGFTTIANDVASFMGNKDAILANLGKTGDNSFHLRAGVEVDSTTSLTVASDWNLYSATRAGDEPGVLTLRAKDNITFNGSLSDGFVTPAATSAIGEGDSWAYRIVAGADFTSANPLGTKTVLTKDASGNATTGNVSIANNKLIRTGTGNIDVATGGDLKMLGAGAAIYTAGKKTDAQDWFVPPTASQLYLSDGGSISIQTQGNIAGGEPTTGRQLINNWLFRQGGGTKNLDTSWWVRPDLFAQSLATLGGGDVRIDAGGSISNFSASLPTTARYDTNGNTTNVKVDGGGDLTINAGGDINNGVYFVAKGEGNINASGSIQRQGSTLGTTLALMDSKFNVSANKGANIDAVINPTLLSQSSKNTSTGALVSGTGDASFFNTYASNAQLNLSSLVGNATFSESAPNISSIKELTVGDSGGLKFYPGSLTAVAFSGDVLGGASLLPASIGNVNLLAANDVKIRSLFMSDADVASALTVANPATSAQAVVNAFKSFSSDGAKHASTPVHSNDNVSALIVAKTGSITTTGSGIDLAKSVKIVAGQDINALTAKIQNVHADDVTLIKAGRDIVQGSNQNNKTLITVAGPGEVLLEAARNIDLGSSEGVNTIANNSYIDGGKVVLTTANPALPKAGASVTLVAGLGSDGAKLDNYIAQYISPIGAGPAALQGDAARMAEYRANTANAVTAYMRKIKNDGSLSDVQALAAFNALPQESKVIFAYRHLSSELLASGESFAKTQNNIRGDNAIAALFPKTDNRGNIALYNSKISTANDGSIDIIVPNGSVNAGLSVAGAKDDIGIITQKGGSIRAFADAGFQVNTSKVITQYGSDITVWVNNGDIDAGRGSKTATSIPERRVTTDLDGNTTIENLGVASGSGIRAQTFDPDGPKGAAIAPTKGKVALIAPRGKLDAGEAGIEAGDFLAVATQVLGADNISVSGASQGVPAAAAAGVTGASAGLSPDATSSAVQDVANSVAQSASQPFVPPSLPSIISVEIMGIGN